MEKSAKLHDVFLNPGEFYFGGMHTRIRTLLGSCIAIVMWHAQRRIGGMCHFVLPRRSKRTSTTLDAKYAEEAFEIFMQNVRASNTRAQDYQVKILGGGNMFPEFPGRNAMSSISAQNILAAHELVRQYKLNLTGENVGGSGHRHVTFEIWNGTVHVKHADLHSSTSEIMIV